MPSNVDRVIRAFTNWPYAYPCPPGGDVLPRTIDPSPPLPAIKVIVVYAPDDTNTSTITERLADDLQDYRHFHLLSHLLKLNDLPHGDAYKKKALCNIDQYSFEKQRRWPATQLLVEIVRAHIDEQVAAGRRKFVICGMPPDNPHVLWWFSQKIAEPSAIVFLESRQSEQWHEQVVGYYTNKNDDKVLSIPVIERDVEQTYQRLLLALAKKALSSPKVMQSSPQVANTQNETQEDQEVDIGAAAQKAEIERKDTPVQDAGGGDLMDELEHAQRSNPRRG